MQALESVIFTKDEQCVGCNKCIYSCPVLEANVSYMTADGHNKIRIDQQKCIMCGECIRVCDHDAREFMDDTDRFLAGLAANEKIILLAAPAVKMNIPAFKRLFGYLHSLGVEAIYDVSLGADIATWAYLRSLAEHQAPVIAQPCPAIVNYVQKYQPELTSRLSTVHSPLMCMATYLRKHENVQGSIAFLSPCIAKIAEINDPDTHNLVQYNVTFAKLLAYLERQGMDFTQYPEQDFALPNQGLGVIYSCPGGLKENVRFYQPEAWVTQVEGPRLAYPYLQEYGDRCQAGRVLPTVVDVLSCQHGCNIGSATVGAIDLIDMEYTASQLRNSMRSVATNPAEALAAFDRSFTLTDFTRAYHADPILHFIKPNATELDALYTSIGKDSEESRHINCNACGYVSCEQMATAIFNKANHKENCLDYNSRMSAERDLMEARNKEVMALLSQVRKKTEELTALNKKLTQMDQVKSDFISTVSHELRTPLTSVLGFARIIQKRLEDVLFPLIATDERKVERAVRQVRDNIAIIVSEGERLTNMINDVLDIAKMEAGKIEWRLEASDMESIVDQATASVQSLIGQKGLRLKKDVAQNLPIIYCDKNRIMQVVINLLSNAIKFTDAGTITCRITVDGDFVQVAVCDQGIGIAKEDQQVLFEKFKQVGDTLTDKPQGTGLGLPICLEIISHHGGRLWVESEIGQGSVFCFTLPITDVAEESEDLKESAVALDELTQTADPSEPGAGTQAGRILVVDDEKHCRTLLRQVLEEAGFAVLEASDGLEAIELAKAHNPKLILLDVMMPGIGGMDVAAALKGNPDTSLIPIVIISVLQESELCFRIGVSGHFTKPVKEDKLLDVVRSLVR